MEAGLSSGSQDAAEPSEIEARERMMNCMQALIRDLGQANTQLARELTRRRRLTRAVSREMAAPVGRPEFESLMLASGSLGLLNLPVTGNGTAPAWESNAVLAPLARRFADAGRIFVNHLRPVPRWEPLAGVIRRSDSETAARLSGLAGDLVSLRLAQAMFRNLPHEVVRDSLDAAGVLVTDGDGLIRLANQRLQALTGLPLDELQGRSWLRALVPEEDWPVMRSQPGFPGLTGRCEHDVWIRNGRGKTFPVKLFGRALFRGSRRVGFVTLIVAEGTEQHQQLENLAQRERLYRRVFEEGVTGQFTCRADGTLLACNAAFSRIFGFGSVGEALQCNLRQLHVSGAAADEFFEHLMRRRRLIHDESAMRRADGREIHVIRNVSGEFDAAGHLQELTGFVYDNTEHRRLEEHVRQTQKMETVGRLVGGMAHDFNNLLLAIQGYAVLLAEHVEANPEAADALAHIRRSADRAANLTRRLLAFSGRQVPQFRELGLNEIVTSLEPQLQTLLGAGVSLETRLADKLGLVRADRAQLEEVLVNLVSNARDAMPQGGNLLISTRNVELRDTWFVFHDGLPPGDYVELAIQDSGTGMSEDVKAHLFEPFFTTKEPGKGTGLGLPTVYGIVKQSGGDVQVYSTLGQGSTIRILLPRIPASGDSVSRTRAPGKTGHFTVLVVEDEPPLRAMVKRVLERAGHRVLDVNHPEEALSKLSASDDPVDLLVTELMLPGMSGRELWERLQARQPELPVVYLSGFAEDAGLRHRRLNFLQKPFKPEALLEKVNQLLAVD